MSPNRQRQARYGDIVTLELNMIPESGFVPEHLFDKTGQIQFVLGWGNYLPGLHELVEGCSVGDKVNNVSVDAGWGRRREELIISVPKSKFDEAGVQVRVGSMLELAGGVQVIVQDVLHDAVVIDGNAPLAGSSYSCTFTVLSIDDCPSIDGYSATPAGKFQVATFALGCFWGAELAFMRHLGVVGTKVGYSQGNTNNPTYKEVCDGRTKHREVVMVVFDSAIVSYNDLLQLAFERMAQTTSVFDLSHVFDQNFEDNIQYRHGFYIHHPHQFNVAKEAIKSNSNRFQVEILEATKTYDAEEHHQQYLYKGGQSARKKARENILCFG